MLQPAAYNLVWTKVGEPQLPPNARDDSNGRLTISGVGHADQGQYRCTGTTQNQIATDDASLRIAQPARRSLILVSVFIFFLSLILYWFPAELG